MSDFTKQGMADERERMRRAHFHKMLAAIRQYETEKLDGTARHAAARLAEAGHHAAIVAALSAESGRIEKER